MTGAQLRTARRKLRMSQRQLAETIGTAPNTVARWERDELPIREIAARFIAHLVAEHAPTTAGPKKGGR